jgi:ABC-type nickel/cobalt efflux system permease component RcnA
MRFPYTFMGIVSLTIALFVFVYLAGHRSLDPAATWMALLAAVVAFGFGVYVLIRRVMRGRET